MKAWWLKFTDGSSACCEGQDAYHAKRIAEKLTGKKVAGGDYKDIAAEPLPYPASPIIWQFDCPVNGKCPAFCMSPQKCRGKSSCPASYACSE
jgi:hypothetical protein